MSYRSFRKFSVGITSYVQLMDVYRINDATASINRPHFAKMNSQRIFHAVITLYEKQRAVVLGAQLGISPFAVRVLDIVMCLPGSQIEDIESLLMTTRARVVSAVFELSGKDLLTDIDPSIGHDDIRLYARNEMQSLQDAGRNDVASGVVPTDLAPTLKAYQRMLQDQIDQWTSGSGESTSEALLRALTKAEVGDGAVSLSRMAHRGGLVIPLVCTGLRSRN